MKISPAAVIPLSLAFQLSGCGGGGPGSFAPPAVTPPPTVSVKAPDTAIAGVAFSVEWTSSDATSCSAPFTTDTGTSGSALVTATVVESTKYSVTCTGAGGSNTGSATVNVSAPLAEGLWQGTTSGGRSVSGVVTKEGDYWLAYSASANGPLIGFYSGHSTQTITALPVGTFTSNDLREVNFATGFSGGNTAVGAISTGNYSAKTSISGTLDAVNGGAFAGATASDTVSTNLPGLSQGAGSGNAALDVNGTLTVSWTGTTTILGTNILAVSFSDVITGAISNGVFTPTAGHTHINSCSPVSGTNYCSSAMSPVENTFNSITGNLNIADLASATFIAKYTSVGGEVTNTYNLNSLNVTLSSLPSIPGNDAFNLNTDDTTTYESTPSLAAVADNYTGTASAETAQVANSTFNIGADGTITGAEGGSGCTYTGTTAIHSTGGNVYDVTLNVAACAAQGDYSGVAIYDATNDKVTVTVLNTARGKGFMFIGVGANH